MNTLRIHSNETRKNLRRLALALIVGVVALAAADAYAVSKAGALFLRVPVGSRAAGMGQAYVAVADDATATHWNPAGLGAAPMSAIWSEVTIPHRYRPVDKFAVVKRGAGGDGFDGYEVWLLGAEGLVMYDGSKWRSGKVYEASPDEDIETIVKRYLQSSDDDEVAQAMAKVALVNNARTLEYIDAFEQKTLSALGENEEWIADISNRFVTLKKSYNICMVYWPRFWEVEKRFRDDSRKSKFGEREFDRLSVGLERSVRRHLPEEIILPFTLSFDGELTALETSEKFVWVGTTEGLHRYDGNRWISFHAAVESAKKTAGDESAGAAKPNTPVVGMTIPSNNIRFLTVDNKRLFIGTDKGLVEHFGIGWEIVGANAGLPQGKASGVTFETVDRGWAVVDDDVYHLSGGVWRNYTELTVGLDETPEVIAGNFSLYGTDVEREKYLAKLYAMNEKTSPTETAETAESAESTDGATDDPGADSEKDSADEPTGESDAGSDVGSVAGSDALTLADETGASTAATAPSTAPVSETQSMSLSLGDIIRAPFVTEIKGEITALYAQNGRVWVGTGEGLISFAGKGWKRFGYKSYTAAHEMTVTDLALEVTRGDSASALMVADRIRNQNDLVSDRIETGKTVWVYRNAAGSAINDIANVHGTIFIATERGALEYDGVRLTRFEESGLGRARTVGISGVGGSLWFATTDKAAFLRQPQRDISLMHAAWLPALDDDINFDFAAYVQNIRGVGTFGLSLTSLDFGTIIRTDAVGNETGFENPRDIAIAVSFGLPVSASSSLGATVKLISSRLSNLGAGNEVGSGSATGVAMDFGLLHRFSNRFTVGVALTNIGPEISYIDAEQSDPLPMNLALGYAWKAVKTDLIELLVVTDGNFSLVERGFEPIFNGGAEIMYADFISFRAGRLNDNAGQVKAWTFGAGLRLNIPGIGTTPIDLAYIPSSEDLALSNTLFTSLEIIF